MKYQSTLYVVATKNQAKSIETDLGVARQTARLLALNDPGRVYSVYEWSNGNQWQDHKTKYEYRGFVILEDNSAEIKRKNDAIKQIRNIEWSQHDSERGHANMQTAHNQLKNWK